jgi:ABC-type glycerol-3-phosphate transport system substrate-binding protein
MRGGWGHHMRLGLRTGVLLVVVVAGIAALSAATAAPSAHGAARTAQRSTTILHVLADPSWRYLATAKQWFEAAHPGVTVDIEAIPNNSYYTNIVQRLSLSNVPDVTVLEMGPGPYATLVSQHLLASLDTIWTKQHLARVYLPVASRAFTSADGHHYAISPDVWWGPQIYYRLDALARAKVPPPSRTRLTVASFAHVMTNLKNNGYVPMAVDGNGDVIGFGYVLSALIETSCGDAAYTNLATNWQPRVPLRTKWSSSCVVDALRTLLRWTREGFFGDQPTTRSYSIAEGLLESGKAASRMDASWMPNELKYDHFSKPYRWSLFPSVGRFPAKFQLVATDALAVPAHSQHVRLAKQFVSIVASKRFESRQAYFDWIGGMPARSDVPTPTRVPVTTRQMREAMKKTGVVLSLAYQTPYGSAGGELTQQINEVLSGQESVSEAAHALEAEVQRERSGH